MSRSFQLFSTFLILFILQITVSGQKKDRTESGLRMHPSENLKKCVDLKFGAILNLPKPKFSAEARTAKIGGTVEVIVKIDEKGNVLEVEKVSGKTILQGPAIEAALKAKFTPTLCDGRAARISGVLIYNFIPMAPGALYFTPKSIEDFKDIGKNSMYYEAIMELTDNYKIAFGYGDRNYYADLPLTRGDFAQFLRLTLEMLKKRAEIANVNISQIGLFSSYNPQTVNSVDKIRDFALKDAFSESLKILIADYNIAMLNAAYQFDGRDYLKQNDLLMLWKAIFGEEAVPVNFQNVENDKQIISRGEFALFLQESLRILTYKLLP